MLTKIMMWVSIAVVLLALLELPITSEPVLVEFVVCATGLLVICQAFRAGQYLLATGFLPIVVAFSPISPIAISGRAFLWLNWIGPCSVPGCRYRIEDGTDAPLCLR